MPPDIKKMKTRELKQEFTRLYDVVHNAQCFSNSDLFRLEFLTAELESRGISICPTTEVHFA